MISTFKIPRRAMVLGAVAGLLPRIAAAAGSAGLVEKTTGQTWAEGAEKRMLAAQAPVYVGDAVATGTDSRLAMMLAETTHVLMGPETSLTIDQYTAAAGGELILGQGAMLFDREEDAPKTPVSLSTAFGLIAVRGTRFFAGPSKGKFGVFVQRGEVRLTGGGTEVTILPGFGSDIAAVGDAPSPPAKWKQARIDAALALVGA